MKKLFLVILLLVLSNVVFADDVTLVTECPVTVIEVEVPVYVDVVEYVEIDVPVYLERESRAVWEINSRMLYVYNVELWDGPVLKDKVVGSAVFAYEWFDDRPMLEMIDVAE